MHFFPLAAHEVTAMTNHSANCVSKTECTATWFHYWDTRWNSTQVNYVYNLEVWYGRI